MTTRDRCSHPRKKTIITPFFSLPQNIALLVFFVGYVILETPSTIALRYLRPSRFSKCLLHEDLVVSTVVDRGSLIIGYYPTSSIHYDFMGSHHAMHGIRHGLQRLGDLPFLFRPE